MRRPRNCARALGTCAFSRRRAPPCSSASGRLQFLTRAGVGRLGERAGCGDGGPGARPCSFRSPRLRWGWALLSRGFRRAPRGRASAGSAGAGPGLEETSGGRPALFLFCTCCSIRESVRSVEFALFIRGMTVSPPESLWLPSRVQRVFRKGQIAWLLPLWSELGLDSLVS